MVEELRVSRLLHLRDELLVASTTTYLVVVVVNNQDWWAMAEHAFGGSHQRKLIGVNRLSASLSLHNLATLRDHGFVHIDTS